MEFSQRRYQPLHLEQLPDGTGSRAEERVPTFDHSTDGEWKRIPYRKLARWTGLLVAIISTVVAIYYSTVGWRAYRTISLPHKAHVVSKAELKSGKKLDVVKPYFGPLSSGALVEDVDLLATIWFKEGVSPPGPVPEYAEHDPNWQWYRPSHGRPYRRLGSEEYGSLGKDYEINGTSWEEVTAFRTHIGKITATRRTSREIVLPGRIVHSLATNPWSRLVATFTLLAKEGTNSPHLEGQYKHSTTRPVDLYGQEATWPPSRSGSSTSPMDAFLTASGIGLDLAAAYEDPPYFNDYSMNEPTIERNESIFTTALVGRTWVVSANDYPMYSLESYVRAVENLRTQQHECRNSTHDWWPGIPHCDRAFQREGQFENSLSHIGRTSENGKDVARYGPFLTTSLSWAAAKDYVKLPKAHILHDTPPGDVKDFKFTWRLTYSALAPFKLEMARRLMDPDSWRYGLREGWGLEPVNFMLPDHVNAAHADQAEFFYALLGHEYNPGSRPISRAIFKPLATCFRYMALFLFVLYWYTRQVSTGIAIEVLCIETICALINQLGQIFIDIQGVNILQLGVACGGVTYIAIKQLLLWRRLEIRFSGFLPTAFRIRSFKEGEWASYKLRRQHGWWIPAVIAAIAFGLLRAGLLPSPLVPATDFEASEILHWRDDPETWISYRPWRGLLEIHRSMDALDGAVWLTARVAQIRLNSESKTFAGSYALGAYFSLMSTICLAVPPVFSGWLGKAEYATPFGAWDIVTFIVQTTMACQARWLPKVPQSP